MSTISSVPSNQLLTTSASSKVTDSSIDNTIGNKGTGSSIKMDKANEKNLLQSSSPSTPKIADILGMLKKVLEVVTALLQLFKNDKGDSSIKEGASPKGSTTGSSTHNCGVAQQRSVQTGNTLPKSGEFLWKPQSDKDGKLAILLPSPLVGKVDSVSVVSPNGSSQKGSYAGVGNGSREHFRFTKPGGDFQDGSKVVITMKDGSLKEVSISDSSARYQM
jgi:hypothetical protein